MWKRLGLLLVAAGLAGCVTQSAEPARAPASFPPEMERLANNASVIWRNCLARTFVTHVGRGLDADSAAEASFLSCRTEERSLITVAVHAGIPEETVLSSMQFVRHEQKQLLLQAYGEAARRVRAAAAQPAAAAPAAAQPARPRPAAQRPARDPFAPSGAAPARPGT